MLARGSGSGPLGSYAYNTHGVAIPGGGYIDQKRGIEIDYPDIRYGLGRVLYNGPRLPVLPVTSEDQIRSPSEMFAIGESRHHPQSNERAGGEDEMVCGMLKNLREGISQWAFDPARHGKNYNQLSCDGHVEAINPWILFDPTKTGSRWNYDNQPHQEFWIP